MILIGETLRIGEMYRVRLLGLKAKAVEFGRWLALGFVNQGIHTWDNK